MTHVKICGIKRPEDALVAIEAGADLLGFVFAPSRRRLTADEAREITAQVHACSSARAVGIFVNADPDEMNRVAGRCELDYVQLSGDEPEEIVELLDVPAIQAIHVGAHMTAEELAARAGATRAEIVLLDTAEKGSYGGTGKTFDWTVVPSLDRPVLLAGGLHPGNVREAVRAIRPWGVDVSSGVETDGEKDHAKIREFVMKVKSDPERRSE
jgi:phosphoribosylanthranilate isomerase